MRPQSLLQVAAQTDKGVRGTLNGMDRTGDLLNDLKIAEARVDGTPSWGEPARHVRREVRRLRAAWESERVARFGRTRVDDSAADSDSI